MRIGVICFGVGVVIQKGLCPFKWDVGGEDGRAVASEGIGVCGGIGVGVIKLPPALEVCAVGEGIFKSSPPEWNIKLRTNVFFCGHKRV